MLDTPVLAPATPADVLATLTDSEFADIFAVALPARRKPVDTLTDAEIADLVLARRIARRRFRWFVAYITADDLTPYTFSPFHADVINELQRVFDGDETRLQISAAPQHGKSTLVARLFPCFVLGNRPRIMIITASYSLEVASEHTRAAREIINGAAFAELFPDVVLADDGQARDFLRTQQGGYLRGVGVGGSLTGFRADALLLDDLVSGDEAATSSAQRNAVQAWYGGTARTRLSKDGCIVSIGTRWRHNDFIGLLIGASEAGTGERWRIRNFPAIHTDENGMEHALVPELHPLSALHRARLALGPIAFGALYMGDPRPAHGTFFNPSWLVYYAPQDLPPPEELRTVVCSDVAVTSGGGDYSVVLVASVSMRGDIFIRHVWRGAGNAG